MKPNNKYLICPKCEQIGHKQILGEIQNNDLLVARFNKGFTRIKSKDYQVVCQCGEVVFQKGTAIFF